MEDQILDACGARITGKLFKHAEEMLGAESGVFVMAFEQHDAFQRQGANYIRTSGEPMPKSAFTVQESRDIPMTEIHLETPQGRVKIINVADPTRSPNPTYGDWDSAGRGAFPVCN